MGAGGEIIIIDYGMGNLGSIANMLKRIGANARVSADLGVIASASKLILPGVGAFDHGMTHLAQRDLVPLLNRRVLEAKVPILGICLGMQLFTERSDEGGRPGLGWIQGQTLKFRMEGEFRDLKVPHMGWNQVSIQREARLFEGMPTDSRFYFVHSFYLVAANPGDVICKTRYGFEFDSALERQNIVGVQFHPEKSHKFGMGILKNFVEQY